MKNPFISLKYRNFRIYWIGMNLSLIGSWMQTIALPWLTLNLTNDAFKVSLVAVSQFIPPLFLTLFSGALLDRFDKKILLAIAQIGMSCVAMFFTIMVFFSLEKFELILLFSFLHGIFMSLDAPSRQSMIYDLIENKENLPNAIALNSMSFNVARIFGPALAGAIMAIFGLFWCFLLNSISYLAVIISLKFIKFPPNSQILKTEKLKILQSIKMGFLYVKNKKILLEMLLIVLIIATFIPNYNVTISAFAKFSLGGGEKTFGYLMSCLGFGAFLGAFYIAMAGKMKVKIIYFFALFTSLVLTLMGFVQNFYIMALMLICTGFGFVVTTSSTNSMVQTNTKNEFRGRVMSIYTLLFQGSTPFGAVFAGFFIDKLGVASGFFISGIISFVLILVLCFKYKNF